MSKLCTIKEIVDKSQISTKQSENNAETEEIQSVETMTPYEAGKYLGKNAEFIRAGLRQNKFDFGVAVASEKERRRLELLHN